MQENILERIERISKTIKEELKKHGVDVQAVYLFGSYAKGEWLKTSDIDLIIVSDDWEGIPQLRRLDILNRIIWERRLGNVEAFPATSKDLREGGNVLLRDASRHWVRVL